MKKILIALALLLVVWSQGDARSASGDAATKSGVRGGFPQTVRIRLWYLHPPSQLKLRADAGQATVKKCSNCKDTALATAYSSQVGPLPHRGMSNYPYDPVKEPLPSHVLDYDRTWNTRPAGGR